MTELNALSPHDGNNSVARYRGDDDYEPRNNYSKDWFKDWVRVRGESGKGFPPLDGEYEEYLAELSVYNDNVARQNIAAAEKRRAEWAEYERKRKRYEDDLLAYTKELELRLNNARIMSPIIIGMIVAVVAMAAM